MLPSVKLIAVPEVITAADRVIYGLPGVEFIIENPTGLGAVNVADVVTASVSVQTPEAVVQNSNLIEPILAVVAVVAATV
jgi:hypothetical protein